MKLVHKIILGNALGIIVIVIISTFSYREFNLLHAKLRFVEIADSLNASFLRMRLSEKNYFLYKGKSNIPLIKKELQEIELTITSLKSDIISAVGEENFQRLKLKLKGYEDEIDKIEETDNNTINMEISVREAGQQLRLFSENIIRLERKKVNEIILASKRTLLYFFGIIIFVALTSTYFFFSRMFKNLRRIEKTANSISKGNFIKMEGNIPENELGSAICAINSMCEELNTRHEQLIQSRKLASLGILTAGVAHELGNPLNNISMVAQTYLEIYDRLGKEDRLDYMETILDESQRIKNIVQNLLDFSKPKETDFNVADINIVIKNALKLVQNMLHISGIETKLNLEEKLPPVFIDENKIQEVLVNLVTNAIQAMSPGNTLFIRTDIGEESDHIIIEIKDTGKGIPPELLDHIFDPFFSTKGTQGTGLGLFVSYGIIKNHKGKIDVRSEVGVGTTTVVELPIYTPKEGRDEWS